MEHEIDSIPSAVLEKSKKELADPRVIFVEEDFKPHWNENLTDDEYHADKTAVGSGSLRKALDSPYAFFQDFFMGVQQPETDALRIGRIVHKAILEGKTFQDLYAVMPEFKGKTKDGRETTSANAADVKDKKAAWIYEQELSGRIIVTQDELDMVVGQIESIMKHPQGVDTIKNGTPEIAGYFSVDGIRLKIKPDLLGAEDVVKLTDLKTSRSTKRRRFGSSAFEHRYDIQMFMYAKGVEAISGKFPDVMTHLCLEKTPPYECAVFYWEREDLMQAETDFYRALKVIRECVEKNSWPQRQKGIERIYTPSWFISEATEGQS